MLLSLHQGHAKAHQSALALHTLKSHGHLMLQGQLFDAEQAQSQFVGMGGAAIYGIESLKAVVNLR